MQDLHNSRENTTKNCNPTPAFRSLTTKYEALLTYMDELTHNKSSLSAQEHEQMIVHLTRDIGRAALGELFERYDVENDIISANSQTYRRKHKASKEYQTALGPVTIERHVYVNRKKAGDGKSICPLEMQAGFIGGYWSPLAAKNASWVLAHLTPQETGDLFLQLGQMNPSRSSLDRLPKLLQGQWEPQNVENFSTLMGAESIPANAHRVAVSLDGVMVGMKPEKSTVNKAQNRSCEWREASCGTMSFFDKDGERISTIQYGRMPESKKLTLKTLLKNEVELTLKNKPDLELIQIADGAQDNWTFFDEEMPLGFQLTDFYHACQYLKSAYNAAYKKDSSKALEKFNHYKTILRDELNGVNKVLRALRYLKQQDPDDNDIIAAVTYFTNNQHRMNYAVAKEKHYPIGSGIVEAACKTLVGSRLKRSGMSWHLDGGQAILTLRSLVKSNRFERAWDLLLNKFVKPVEPLANVVSLFE